MSAHAVVIVGGGPTGMMLAAELALAGVEALLLERRIDAELESSRAGGLHARTIEVLDQRGVAERFLAAGQTAQVQRFAGVPLDISDFPTRHPYGLALWQKDFEQILRAWLDELGVAIHRGAEVVGIADAGTGVVVTLADGGQHTAEYVVGCDGSHSRVRQAAGIDFAGWDPSVSSLVAEVEVRDEPPLGMRYDANGTQALGRLADGRIRLVVTEPYAGQSASPGLEDLRQALVGAFGTDFGVHSPSFISRFTDASRQATAYRAGRVLLAGDAAHVHYPVSGQGLNLGVQDAVNLGWKLAQVVRGAAAPTLLDTYHAERHPVAARVLQMTMAQTALTRAEPRIEALRAHVGELLALDEPRRRYGALISGLDIHYDLGPGHPLVGRRMPDAALVTSAGETSVFHLLHDARPVLLNWGLPGATDAVAVPARLKRIDAQLGGALALPVLGAVPTPAAVLIRPDGHVAWAGAPDEPGLRAALATWCDSRDAPSGRAR